MNWNGVIPNSFWHDSHRILFNKDCRFMTDLPDETVQMVCCSPPYWGLRKYAGLPDLIWGGDGSCGHQWDSADRWLHRGSTKLKQYQTHGVMTEDKTSDNTCSLCGAVKSQLGLEPTPEAFISHLVEIFREVRRVLRKDGVVFLNIGDSYISSASGSLPANSWQRPSRLAAMERPSKLGNRLKPKDLCLIPFRLAIALQADGWWCRSVIIWHKSNPMPSSVTDRPSTSHEYILMLTKSARYYWDATAVREPLQPSTESRYQYDTGFHQKGGREISGFPQKRGFKSKHGTTFGEQEQHHGQDINSFPSGRNMRSVWTFSTQSFSGAHFATYPEELVRRCVLAATPEVGCCSKCGKPWMRIVEVNGSNYGKRKEAGVGGPYNLNPELLREAAKLGNLGSETKTLGWKPQCKCNADKIPSIVLDPFAGSGTTLLVAANLNRRAIGYELSESYCRLTVEKNKQGVIV